MDERNAPIRLLLETLTANWQNGNAKRRPMGLTYIAHFQLSKTDGRTILPPEPVL